MSAKRGKKAKPNLYSHIASAIIPVTSIVAVPAVAPHFPQQKVRANEEWGPMASTLLRASFTSQLLVPSTSSKTSLNQYDDDDDDDDDYVTTKKRTAVGSMDASTDDDDSDDDTSSRKRQDSLHASTVRSSVSRIASISDAEKRLFGHVDKDEEPPTTTVDPSLSTTIHLDQKQPTNAEVTQSSTTSTTGTKSSKRAPVTIVRQHVPPIVSNPTPSRAGPSSAKVNNQVDGIGDEAKSMTTTTARSSLNDAASLPVSARSVSFKEPLINEVYEPSSSKSQQTTIVQVDNKNYSVLDKIVIPPPEGYQPNFNDLEKHNQLLIDEVQQLRVVNRNLQTQQQELLNRLQTSQKLSQRELNELLKQAGQDQTKDLENLNKALQNRCDHLENELVSLRERYAQDQGQSSRRELKDENQFLKDYVYRLNAAASEYQSLHPPDALKDEMNRQQRNVKSLPLKGPIPIWLLHQKFLSPLFVCYDEKLHQKDEFIRKLQSQLNELYEQATTIVNENKTLREQVVRTSVSSSVMNPPSTYVVDLENIKRQAHLVLEENRVLQDQLNLQTSKLTDVQKTQMQEVSDLTRRLMIIENEKAEADRLVKATRIKNEELTKKYEQLIIDNDHRMHVEDHVREISEMKRVTDDLIKKHASEMQLLLRRVQESESAKRVAQLQLSEYRNAIERLKDDITATKKINRKLLLRIQTYEKKLELQQMKEQRTSTMLDKANEEIEKSKLEQENYFLLAKTKDEEINHTKSRMEEEAKKLAELENRLQSYKDKSKENLNESQEQTLKQNENLKTRCTEQDQRIQQLKTLLNEKQIIIDDLSTERRNLEIDLETLCKTTNADNRRMREQLLDMHAVR